MREILFRGFGITSRMWHEGELINTTGTIPPYMPMILVPDQKSDGHAYDIYPESVGQFTGVIDKKGKKIFEGDIVKVFGALGKLEGCGVVNWSDLFSAWHIGKLTAMYGSKHCATYEVIGNIHDNPELLEE